MTIRFIKFSVIGVVLGLFIASGCTWKTKTLAVEAPPIARSSLVYDANGDVITHFRGEQHRLVVQTLDEIPKIVQNAVIAIEDERFWQHKGVDLRAIARAARSNLNQGGISEGGSTITQQYVGLTFLDRTDKSTSRKIEEISLALQFERRYSKEYILREYLNAVYFGEGAYGIKAAAQEYFGADLDELTLGEASLLAGLIQAPSALNPYVNPNQAIRKRREVLDRMLANEWITQKEFDTARTEPVVLKPRVPVLEERYSAPHFVEEVRQWFLSNPIFGETRADRVTMLFEGGLHIYTTLDPVVQEVAETAVARILPDPNGPDAAVVVIDNDTGYIKAVVGGRDFFGERPEAKFNLATQGGRQVGSAMKPITLASALEQGIKLTDEYFAPPKLDIPIPERGISWEVAGGEDNQKISLYEGLVDSVNTVYAQLSRDVGPINTVNMAERLGFESTLEPTLSVALGSSDVTSLDMATAFSTFARRGVRIQPTYVTQVAAADGTLLYDHVLDGTRVLDRNIADQVNRAMVDVVRRGTGTNAAVPGLAIAGKTGTSANFHDAAFSGFSPDFTISVWVGFPNAQIPMEPPLTPIRVFGGTYPAQIFQLTMKSLAQDGNRTFALPSNSNARAVPVSENVKSIRVPNVDGLSRLQAVNLLNSFGFVTGIIEVLAENSADVRIRQVIEQDPTQLRIAEEGSVVTLTVVDLPSDCRTFLELVAESPIVEELVLGSRGYIEDNLQQNLNILSAYYILPTNCQDYLEFQNSIRTPQSEPADAG